MIYAQNQLRTYLEVYAQSIPPHHGNTQKALVTLKTAGKTLRALAHRHEGGQRVSLPLDLQQILIERLLAGDPVTIELPGYSTTLNPEQFSEEYHKLQKTPLSIPIQLPFKLG